MKIWKISSLVALIAAVLALLGAPAEATIFKCRDAQGVLTFSDRGCVQPAMPSARPRPTVAPESLLPPPSAPPAAAAPPTVVGTEATATTAAEAVGTLASSETPVLEQQRHEPLRARKARSGHWGIVSIGLAGALVSYVMMIVAAFRAGSTGWGIALILLSPISNLLYALRHWHEARAGFAIGVVATAVCVAAYVPPVNLIDVSDSFLTTRGDTDTQERRARVSFSQDETVYLKTILQWDDWSVGSTHFVGWIWYTGDQPRNSHMMPLDFDETPFVLLGYMPAAALGAGKHRVEVYVDGQLFDVRSFEVI